jgi:hypothetical protein
MGFKADGEIAQNTLFFRKYFKIGDGEIKIHKIFCKFLCHRWSKKSISPRNTFFLHAKKSKKVRFVTRRRFDTKEYCFPSLHRNESKSKIGEGRHCDDLHIITENTYTRVLRRMRRKYYISSPPLHRFEVKPKHEKYFYFCIIVASKYF